MWSRTTQPESGSTLGWWGRVGLAGLLAAAALVLPGGSPASAVDGCSSRTDGTAGAGLLGAQRGAATTPQASAEAGGVGDAGDLGADGDAPTGEVGVEVGTDDPPADGTGEPATEETAEEATGETTGEPGSEPTVEGDQVVGGDGTGEDTENDQVTQGEGDPSGDSEETTSDDSSDATAALSIDADASPQVVEQGDQLTIQITVSNAGPGTDPAVTVNALMPDGFVVVDAPQGYDASSGVFDAGSMDAGDTVTLTIVVRVVSDVPEVVASPTVSGEAQDGLVDDNTACALVDVQSGDTDDEGSVDEPGSGDADDPSTPDDDPATGDDDEADEPEATVTWGSDPSAGSGDLPDDSGSDSDGSGDGADGTDGTDGTSGEEDTGSTSSDDSTADTPTEETSEEGVESPAETDDSTAMGQVSSTRTGSDAALMVLGGILLAAGVGLVVAGRLRRRDTFSTVQR